MTNIIALDIVIGLVFVYLLYSMLATIIQELLATTFSFRSKLLERAIFRMLEDGKIFDRKFSSLKAFFKTKNQQLKQGSAINLFYDHPLIKYLSEDKCKSKPSYITKEAFSKVMIDLLKGEDAELGDDLKPFIENSIKNKTFGTEKVTISDETHKFLRSIWLESQGDVVAFRKILEKWFDDTMERCTGWYKKKTQYILLVIGLVIAILFNVDTINIAGKLQKDPKLREMVVQQADAYTKAHPNLLQERAIALKNVESDVKITLQNDTIRQYTPQDSIAFTTKLDSIARAKNDSLLNRGILLTHRADSLLNSDIEKLKLNYAHLGIQHGELIDWTQCIFNQMKSYPNIYADISSIAHEADFYDKLTDLINKNESSSTISERLLFGTDFLINLTAIESYNHYLANLQNCKDAQLLNKMCTENPERFLFGTGDF